MSRYYYAQNREDLLIRAFFPDVDDGTYIDVGANDPVIGSVTKLLYDDGWSGINIEPQTTLFAKLEAARPRDLNLNIGVGASDGQLLFSEFPAADGLSSFAPAKTDHPLVERLVEMRTLRSIITRANLAHIHVLKVDVAGFEHEVLAGMDWEAVRPELICIAVNGAAPERDLQALLRDARYEHVFHDGLNDYWLASEASHRRDYFDYPQAALPEGSVYFPAAMALRDEWETDPVARRSISEGARANLHLIVDVQILQTGSRHRGMGRYTLALIDALRSQDVECTFIVTSERPPVDAAARAVLEQAGTIVELPLNALRPTGSFRRVREQNRRVVTAAVADISEQRPAAKVVFLIAALFDFTVCPVFPAAGAENMLLVYDLIPYLLADTYLKGGDGREYSARFGEFYRADHYACDSESAASDLNVYLGVDPQRTTAVLGGTSFSDALTPRQPAFAQALNRFVLVATGDDPRKNNERAAEAFAALGPQVTPIFTSTFSDVTADRIRALCPHAVFSGHIPDDELLWLTDHAEFVLFPSVYEGLGLPMLDAVERGTPVVCSRIPAFTEISPTAFDFFDPWSTQSMTDAVVRAAATPRDRAAGMPAEYSSISDRFHWPDCAERLVKAAFRAQPAKRHGRLAVLGPSPSSFSAIGKLGLQIHAELSRHFDVDYYGEDGLSGPQPVRFNLLEHTGHYFPADEFLRNMDDYDHVLYHLGNSDFHTTAFRAALARAGTAVVHDTRLDSVLRHLEDRGHLPSELRAEIARLDAACGVARSSGLAWLVTNQDLITTYSHYALEAVDEIPHSGRLIQTPLPTGTSSPAPRPSGGCRVAFAGIVSAVKGFHLADDIASIDGVTVTVFGFDPWRESAQIPQRPNITFAANLTDLQFQQQLAETDVIVNYRAHYNGECSRSTLEAMGAGAVVVVRRIGWFAELPDEVVIKVDDEHEIAPAVARLAHDPGLRLQIGEAARAYVRESYGYGSYAAALAEAIRATSPVVGA